MTTIINVWQTEAAQLLKDMRALAGFERMDTFLHALGQQMHRKNPRHGPSSNRLVRGYTKLEADKGIGKYRILWRWAGDEIKELYKIDELAPESPLKQKFERYIQLVPKS